MARRKPDLTPERASRLCKMLRVLGNGPQPKDILVRRLGVEERGFFRDLKLIRELGITIDSSGSSYRLTSGLDDALYRVPMPDLKLSLREALELSQGRSPVHRLLRRKLVSMVGPVRSFEKPAAPRQGSQR